MDRLREDDIERMRSTSPEEKARQAISLMRTGIRLKRAALRTRHPEASEEEIEALLQAWLDADPFVPDPDLDAKLAALLDELAR